MKKSFTEDTQTGPRPAHVGLFSIIRVNKALSFAIFAILIAAVGIFGYSLGSFTFASSGPSDTAAAADPAVVSRISDQEVLCLEIETIDQQARNQALQEENDTIKQETESIADTILNSLMSNLKSKELASRSHTIEANIQEARNLLNLYWKLQKFKKTDSYGLVDISEYENALTARLSYIPTLKPIPGTFGGYGWRIHPIYHYRQFHPAADQGAPKGTKVKAAASGVVVRASWDKSMGYNIEINHGNGFVTIYMHHSKNLVVAGQKVKQGQVIALVGSTGTATGPHLHFEVRYNGAPLNPQKILMQ